MAENRPFMVKHDHERSSPATKLFFFSSHVSLVVHTDKPTTIFYITPRGPQCLTEEQTGARSVVVATQLPVNFEEYGYLVIWGAGPYSSFAGAIRDVVNHRRPCAMMTFRIAQTLTKIRSPLTVDTKTGVLYSWHGFDQGGMARARARAEAS
jgi:hypothetical protein